MITMPWRLLSMVILVVLAEILDPDSLLTCFQPSSTDL